ncbi:DUF2264 domain-containing protein [Microbacterium suwonense]|uniref:DUF2264 domain-containing protein n=1 Tax=Microbacterium suwonense TaxID=683047 RepID=A0ABM8FXI6_9MICO|nr:DUF2264 domain-containing protein [Microbacterium suwonense]BDZ40429.1 hypothetical protein GCM10025863_30430 [Microbacterium suwonense]
MTRTSQPSERSSMRTGSRDALVAFADRMLSGAAAWASPGFARITPPGAPGGYGTAVDGLEGFARTFLLAGFRIVGAHGEGVDGLIRDYTRGIVAGVDPASEERWVRLDEHPQAKVEAASIALILDMTRPWIWDRLDVLTRQRVIDYLTPVVGDDTYPRNNWVWFRIVVQTFLRSVGGPWSASDIAADLARHDSFARGDGWFSDGDERAYDHYVGWALHLYPVLWSRMQGAAELAAELGEDRFARDVEALDRYLQDAVHLVGADGAPLIQGRSLIYRFAAAAPFWVGALAQVPSTDLGTLRHVAMGVIAHFDEHGAPDQDDLLSMGWHAPWRRLAQNYSGPSSPYWAAKGMLGIALPADHPVWAAPEPAPGSDDLRTIAPAGWIVSGTASDGIVRVINHGTDHAEPDAEVGDSPLYARMGYSTASSPLLNGDAWAEPLEQSVALVDAAGRATHRAGMALLRIDADADGGVAVAASVSRVHWIDPAEVQVRHGSGITGAVTVAGRITTCSIVRGAWEVRLVRIDVRDGAGRDAALRIGGWALAGEPGQVETTVSTDAASARLDDLVSIVVPLTPGLAPGIERRTDASPLGPDAAVPVVTGAPEDGTWIAAAVLLGGAEPPASVPSLELHAEAAVVGWPDGRRTTTRLPRPSGA